MDIFNTVWDTVFINPILNVLAFGYDLLGNNIGWSIIVVTIIIRLLLTPLTLRQTRQMKRLQVLQPQIKQLQKRYSSKDAATRKKLSEETFKLYKQAGVNPIGCLGPIVIQIPIWIAFYRAILLVVPVTPEGFATLGRALYSFNPALAEAPFNAFFLGINMVANTGAAPTPWQFGLPFLVGATLWLQQSLSTAPASDPQQQRTQRLTLWMLPIMFGVFTYFFPAGLALYILVSNIVGVLTYIALGNRPNITIMGRKIFGGNQSADSHPEDNATLYEKEVNHDRKLDVHRQNRRRGSRASTKNSGSKSRRH